MRVDFMPSAGPTVGVEWELGLIDPATADLVSAASGILEAVRTADGRPHPRVHQELMLNTVELVTGMGGDLTAVVAGLVGELDAGRPLTQEPAAARTRG